MAEILDVSVAQRYVGVYGGLLIMLSCDILFFYCFGMNGST